MGGLVVSGQKLQISARDWNDLQDLLRRVRGRGTEGQKLQPSNASGGTVAIKNISGSNRKAYEVLAITDQTTDPAYLLDWAHRGVVFKGDTPTANKYQKHLPFVVLLEPIVDDGIGAAQLVGNAWARINIVDAGHRFARIKASDATQLESDFWGGARIVYKPSGTGLKLAQVDLGNYWDHQYVCKPDAGIAKGSTGTVSVWSQQSGTWADTGINVSSAAALGAAVTSGKYCSLWCDDGPLVAPWEC